MQLRDNYHKLNLGNRIEKHLISNLANLPSLVSYFYYGGHLSI